MNRNPRESESCGSELARDSAQPPRGYRSLRYGRWSHAGVTYFVTFCTEGRRKTLVTPPALSALSSERTAMETDAIWRVRAWVVMPDHVHILFDLGERLPLGRAVGRIKSKTGHTLRTARLAWQRGYFEHRLRSIDELRPTLYYIFMNSVRAGLAARGEDWPGFYCCAEDWNWFGDYAREAVIEPAWLTDADGVASKLAPTAPNRGDPA